MDPATQNSSKGRQIVSIAASTITPMRVAWLWAHRIPLGMLTLLFGDPGRGKSLLTCWLAAQVSRGNPDFPHGTVLMLTAEDSLEATVLPRLQAAGADLANVRFLEARREGVPDGLRLPDDVDSLAEEIEKTDARLVVIDPLSAHLPGSVNTWQDQSVRGALAPLHRLAEVSGCAILLVAHLNKNTGVKQALYRVGGSIGLPGAVRSALLFGTQKGTTSGTSRIVAHAKCNVGPLTRSLLYEIEEIVLASGLTTVRLTEVGASDLDADDLLGGLYESPKLEAARAFLENELAEPEWHAVDEIRTSADADGHAWKTISRAAHKLGVEREKTGFPATGRWRLPRGNAMDAPGPSAAQAFLETRSDRASAGDPTKPDLS